MARPCVHRGEKAAPRSAESALARSRPLDGAPGWRVVERPPRTPWRAGYVILPLAIIVGSLQVFIPSDSDRIGWREDRRQGSASEAPSSTGEPAAGAPQAERQPQPQPIPESTGRSAEPQGPPLPNSRPLASAGAVDETAAVGPSAIRVFIHHVAGTRNALPAIQLAAFLQARGFAVTDIRPVELKIEQPSVRYFFEDDQPESRRLVEAIGAFFAEAPERAPDQPADFSHFSPKPRQGNVEVWLPPPGAGESQST
jgi:hypothetical protein